MYDSDALISLKRKIDAIDLSKIKFNNIKKEEYEIYIDICREIRLITIKLRKKDVGQSVRKIAKLILDVLIRKKIDYDFYFRLNNMNGWIKPTEETVKLFVNKEGIIGPIKKDIRNFVDPIRNKPFQKLIFCQMVNENMRNGQDCLIVKDSDGLTTHLKIGHHTEKGLAEYISKNFVFKGAVFSEKSVINCWKNYKLKFEYVDYLKLQIS